MKFLSSAILCGMSLLLAGCAAGLYQEGRSKNDAKMYFDMPKDIHNLTSIYKLRDLDGTRIDTLMYAKNRQETQPLRIPSGKELPFNVTFPIGYSETCSISQSFVPEPDATYHLRIQYRGMNTNPNAAFTADNAQKCSVDVLIERQGKRVLVPTQLLKWQQPII